MTQIQLAVKLDQLTKTGSVVYFKLENEIIDFVSNSVIRINILSESSTLDVEVGLNDFYEILTLLEVALFQNGISIIGWNLKPFLTYVFYRTNTKLDFDKQVFDLKIAEAYVGTRLKAPQTFQEMKDRLKTVISDSSWIKLKSIYGKIYVPLITQVIPAIESEGLFDLVKRKKLHSCYDVDGTVNGRLSCSIPFSDYFNPHSLSEEQKTNLVPYGTDFSFISYDFDSMEVCALAWLCKDGYLQKLVNSEDFYRTLFKLLSGSECDTDGKRDVAKKIFLPVIYGEGIKTLAESIGVGLDTAKGLIQKLRKLFPTLFSWLEVSGNVDYFGRKRNFAEGEEYKFRNFKVQSPSSLICLERLVRLYQDLGNYGKIVAHIHDGYVIKAHDKQIETVKSIALSSLESESELCVGLKLRTKFKIGKNLV